MSKKLGALVVALCMTGGVAYAAEGDEELIVVGAEALKPLPVYVGVDNSNPKRVLGICDYIWRDDDMEPMPVTVKFAAGGKSTADWTDAAEATGSGWDLKMDPGGNTWGRAWTLTTSEPITDIWLNAYRGKKEEDVDDDLELELVTTVFDIRLGAVITEGSANGYPFTTVAGTGPSDRKTVVDPPAGLIATYENPIWIGSYDDDPPEEDEISTEHDLYGKLHIHFETPFIGNMDIPAPLFFRADTDCVLKVEGSLESDGNGGINARMTVEPGDQALLEKDGEEVGKIVFGEDCPNGFTCESVSDNEYRAEINLAAEPGSTYDLWALTADSQDWELVDTYPKD